MSQPFSMVTLLIPCVLIISVYFSASVIFLTFRVSRFDLVSPSLLITTICRVLRVANNNFINIFITFSTHKKTPTGERSSPVGGMPLSIRLFSWLVNCHTLHVRLYTSCTAFSPVEPCSVSDIAIQPRRICSRCL